MHFGVAVLGHEVLTYRPGKRLHPRGHTLRVEVLLVDVQRCPHCEDEEHGNDHPGRLAVAPSRTTTAESVARPNLRNLGAASAVEDGTGKKKPRIDALASQTGPKSKGDATLISVLGRRDRGGPDMCVLPPFWAL